MALVRKSNTRIYSYDFFRGIIGIGLIFFLTFFYLSPTYSDIEFFYRWTQLGFVFFSGLISGTLIKPSQKGFKFFRKGIQIIGMLIGINLLFILSNKSISISDIPLSILEGDIKFIAPLLFPIGIFFLLIPIFQYIPSLLGLFWSIGLFFILDIISLDYNIVRLELFLLSFVVLGFFIGRSFSLENFRKKWNTSFIILPFLFLYIAFAILFAKDLFTFSFLSILSIFWSFHALIFFLFFFALPNSLFFTFPNTQKSSLRNFFEPLGVDLVFLYIFIVLFFESITLIFPDFFLTNIISIHIFAIHISILCFSIISIIQKIGNKNKNFRRIFRYIF